MDGKIKLTEDEKEIDYWVQYNGYRLGTEPEGIRERYRRNIERQRARRAEQDQMPIPTIRLSRQPPQHP